MTGSLDIRARLRDAHYIPDETLVTALQLSLDLQRPLLLEGEAGVGKTEIARALAAVLDARLIRLQCYEGLDASSAIYEWNYQRQLLAIKAKEHDNVSSDAIEAQIFSEAYLLRRPLLEAISQAEPPVLLIDEIDRADEEFEAYPARGAVGFPDHRAGARHHHREKHPPCHPDLQRHARTVGCAAPPLPLLLCRISQRASASSRSCWRACRGSSSASPSRSCVSSRALRKEDLEKVPGVAETLDWATALVGMRVDDLNGDVERIRSTLDLPAQDRGRPEVGHVRSGQPAGREGGVMPCPKAPHPYPTSTG